MVIVVCARYAGLVVKVSSLENTDASSSCAKTWTIPVTLNVIIHYFVANILVERHATGVNLIVVCSDVNTELILLTVHQITNSYAMYVMKHTRANLHKTSTSLFIEKTWRLRKIKIMNTFWKIYQKKCEP